MVFDNIKKYLKMQMQGQQYLPSADNTFLEYKLFFKIYESAFT